MVSACIRPLIQKCEVIKSVPWGPHYGVKLVLNIDFESVLSRQLIGKISRRTHHKVGATLEGSDTDLMEEADPSLWDAAKTQMYFRRQKAFVAGNWGILWKSLMSWVTLWKLGATPQLNTGFLQEERVNPRCQGSSPNFV